MRVHPLTAAPQQTRRLRSVQHSAVCRRREVHDQAAGDQQLDDGLRNGASSIPTLLAKEGLDAALAALVARAPGAVTLHGRAGDNLPGPAAAAAYFAVAEGLTNAARHSGASSIDVRVSRDDDRLRIEVADDGAGGAELGAGSGLLGLRTRLADQGGKLTLESPSGAGTLLRVELPLEPVPVAGDA